MKRMVKNGDLIDVEPDGSITVAGKPIGGGGNNDREISLTMPYPTGHSMFNTKVYIDDETYNKINQFYYETIKLFFNDGNPIGVFHVFDYFDSVSNVNIKQYMTCSYSRHGANPTWYGNETNIDVITKIITESDGDGKYLRIFVNTLSVPSLVQSKFDALYKLADKPTQDGTYILKATVSGGAVTYTWEAQA